MLAVGGIGSIANLYEVTFETLTYLLICYLQEARSAICGTHVRVLRYLHRRHVTYLLGDEIGQSLWTSSIYE